MNRTTAVSTNFRSGPLASTNRKDRALSEGNRIPLTEALRLPNRPCDLKRDPRPYLATAAFTCGGTRGQVKPLCYLLVTKCIKINLHCAFMPPFQIGESSSARNRPSSCEVECCAATRETIPLHQVERHMAQDGEIVCAVIVAISRLVLVHDGVENPVEPVFDTPMRTSDLTKPFGRQRSTQQVTSGLGSSLRLRCLGCGRLFLLPPDPAIDDVLDRRHLGADQAGASLDAAIVALRGEMLLLSHLGFSSSRLTSARW